MNSTIPRSILLMRLEVLKQNSPHLFDRLGVRLRRMAGANDLLRSYAVDVRAFISNEGIFYFSLRFRGRPLGLRLPSSFAVR